MIVRHHYSREVIDAAHAGNFELLRTICRENAVKLWEALGIHKDGHILIKTSKSYPAPQGGVIVESDVEACETSIRDYCEGAD